MPDDYFTRSQAAARRSGPSLRAVLGTSLLAFIGGAALVGWLVWDGRITLTQNDAAPAPASASASFANLPKPAASPTAAASSEAAQDAALGGMDQRIAALEQRLTRIDLQAAASEGNTARAEALLVAFAARRALERGAPLGYLAGLVGIGGGVFLAPLLHLTRWNGARRIAATASLFILINSLAGLVGQLTKNGTGRFAEALTGALPLLVAVVIGGQLGSLLALRILPERVIRWLTAALTIWVGGRLLIGA